MNDNRGYISLYRSIQNHWLYGEDEPFSYFQAWVDLLMLAKYKDEVFHYRGREVFGKRGRVYRSIAVLSKRWNWSREKTNKFLKALEREGMIVLEASRTLTEIEIVNYAKYQGFEVFSEGQDGNGGYNETDNETCNRPYNSHSFNESGNGLGYELGNELGTGTGDEPDTSNNINNKNKDNNTYSDIELSKSDPAERDNDDPDNEDDNEDDDGAAFYRMMVEQYGPEVK